MPSYVRSGTVRTAGSLISGTQMHSTTTALGDGGFLIIWQSADPNADGSGYAVRAQRYNAQGVAVGGETLINNATAGDQNWPRTAILSSGGYVVTWDTSDATQDGSGFAIKARLFDSSGVAVGAEFRVNSQTFGDQKQPNVVGLSDGGFLIAWETGDAAQDGSGSAIKAQRFNAAGAAVGGEFLVNSTTVGSQFTVDVAALASGGFVVTWQTGNTSGAQVRGQIYGADGARIGAEFNASNGTGTHTNAHVTALQAGGFLLTWVSGSSSLAQFFDSVGNKVGTQLNIGGSGTEVAVRPDGNLLFTWSDLFGNVKAQVYDTSGQALGPQTTVLQGGSANGLGSGPSVAILANGNIVLSWDHIMTGPTSDLDIKFQILKPNIGLDIGAAARSVSVAENFSPSQAVTTVAPLDSDGVTIAYQIVGGADAARFTLDSTGQLRFNFTPNFEAPADSNGDNVYDVIVKATDGEFSDTQNLSVVVTNVNEAPTITSHGSSFNVSLNVAENQTAVTTLTATDPDAGTNLVYSIISGADRARFTINASTGVLSFVSAPNFEAPTDVGANNVYDVTVAVSDGSKSDSKAFAITVTNVNEGVTISGSQTAYLVTENSLSVGTFSATDGDGDALTWTIAGGADAARFAIDPTSGALRFVAAPNFEAPGDAGSNNIYDVVISASDGSLSASRALTVQISDQNEGPLIVSGGGGDTASISVAENVNLAATIVADDPDAQDSPYTFSITGGADAALFYVHAQTGQLYFRSNVGGDFEAPADADHNNVYEVTVSVSDGTNPADTQALFITVTNVNEAPVITSDGGGALAALSRLENQLAVTTVAATDVDSPTLAYGIAGGADAALFTIDSQTGLLSFITAPNYEAPGDSGADNVYNVTVSVSDGDKSDTQSLSIVIGNVNDAPVITSNGGGDAASVAVAENGLAVTVVAAADPEGARVSYAIAGGADASRFAINSFTGALRFVAGPDFEQPGDADGDNVYLVTVQASDGALTDSQALSITVGNVNERPVIVSNGGGASASIGIYEGQTAVTNVAASDVDGPGAPTYSIGGGANAALFAIDSATGALSFIAAPDYEAPAAGSNNVYSVTVTASDGALSSSQSIQVTVGNVNEGVTITSGATASVVENGTAVAIVSAVDGDGDPVSFSIAGGADAARFAIDSATGALSFVAAPDFEAPGDSNSDNVYEVVVSASDGSLSSSKSLAVTVTNQNEAIAFVSGGGGDRASVTIGENSGNVMALLAVDPDGVTPQYGIAGGADAALFELDPATHGLRFKDLPDFERPRDSDGDNVYEVVVGTTDGQTFDYQSVSVTVANVYEGVSFGASDFQFPVAENSSAVGAVAAVSGESRALTYSIGGGEDSALFAIDSATGALSFVAAPDFEAPWDSGADNAYHLTVTASDGTSGASQLVTVFVGNVDEAVQLMSYGGAAGVSLAMAENGTQVGRVKAFDPDGTAVTYSIAGGSDSGLFQVDAATGSLSFLGAPDFERPRDFDGDNVYDVVVAAASGGSTATQAFAVSITNRNEGIFISSNGGGAVASVAVGENGLAATRVTAFDPDGTIPSFKIVGGADAARFTIDAQSGVLTFVSAPDFEAPGDLDGNNVYLVSVAASDGEYSARQDLSIIVGNVNEGVDITSGGGGASASVNMAENATAVTVVAARDPDGDRVTYAIAGGADSARFTIDAATGALAFRASPDFEAPTDAGANNVYDVVVSASDGTFTDTQALAITVGNVNEPVTITSNGGGASATATIAENGTAVLKVIASDPDGGPVTYAIVGGADAARFTIDSATGSLAFLSAPDFEAPTDAGANNVYDVVVSASDGTFTDTQALAVTVANVNEALVITSNGGGATGSVSVAENSAAVTIVAAADPEGAAVTYSIVGGLDSARFTINAQTGALQFVAAPDWELPGDSNKDNVYAVIVRASDGVFSDDQALSVSVTNMRDGANVTGTAGNDTISATSTTPALRTTNSEDLVFGRDGHDTLYGMGGDDDLYGEAGNDILVGGEGADRLLGGLGKDQFTFNSVSESTAGSIDLIQDFSRAQADKISLSGIDANSLLIGDQAFSFIGTAAFSHVAGQLRFETSGGVTTIWGDVNGDGVGDLQIQLSGSIALVASDFLL